MTKIEKIILDFVLADHCTIYRGFARRLIRELHSKGYEIRKMKTLKEIKKRKDND